MFNAIFKNGFNPMLGSIPRLPVIAKGRKAVSLIRQSALLIIQPLLEVNCIRYEMNLFMANVYPFTQAHKVESQNILDLVLAKPES